LSGEILTGRIPDELDELELEELDELVLDELALLEEEVLEELLEAALDEELLEVGELPPHPVRPSRKKQVLAA